MEECWSVRRGTLFELDVLLKVDVECGFLACEASLLSSHARY